MTPAAMGEAPVLMRGVRRSVEVGLLPGLAAAVGIGLVTWWAFGNADTGEDYLVGPFNLPVWVEPISNVAGLALLALAVTAVWVPALRRGPRLAVWTVALLCVTAAFAAVTWRVVTAGTVGANIGAGVGLLLGPSVCSFLLAAGAFIEGWRRGRPGRELAAAAVLTALVGPVVTAMFVVAA